MADGIMNKDQLLSLTLRQLRQEASKLSVPLYSRKTKAVLVELILKYQEKSTKKTYTTPLESKSEENYESNTFNTSEEVKTNVVFLVCFSWYFNIKSTKTALVLRLYRGTDNLLAS